MSLVTRHRSLLWEKIPFLVLAVAASAVTLAVQQQGGAVITVGDYPLDARIGNALISYCRYLGKIFWPADLAVFYPYPGYWPLAAVLLAGALLCGISVLLFLGRRRYPFLLVGWLWFVGTLVPVIGLVQVGKQAIADRYAYIPSLGLLILVIWGAHELTRRWRFPKFALVASGAALIFLCLVLTRQQLGYWKNSETLFRHTLAVTKDNFFIDYNLGVILYNQGQTREATELFQETIRIAPNYADAHVNLGVALLNQGQTVEAIRQFQEAIRFRPDDEDAYYNLGVAFLNHGRTDEAIRELQAALRLNPNDTDAKNKLAGALELKNK